MSTKRQAALLAVPDVGDPLHRDPLDVDPYCPGPGFATL
jgi:hypothetical protein